MSRGGQSATMEVTLSRSRSEFSMSDIVSTFDVAG